MTTTTQPTTTQMYQVYIKATPQAIWDAVTKPEWTEKFGYGGRADYNLRPGGSYKHYPSREMVEAGNRMGFVTPDIVVDGEVIESDPPRKLVQTWRMCMEPTAKAEGFTRLTYEIEDWGNGVSKLTLTHELETAPHLALIVSGSMGKEAGGGWPMVLSGLKTLLETGTPLR